MEENKNMTPDQNKNGEIHPVEAVPERPQKSSKKILLNILLLVVVCAIGIWFIFKFSSDFSESGDMKSFSQAFSEMNVWFFILSLVMLGLYILSDGLKYYVIAKTATGKAKLKTSCKTALLGKFYDNITPSSTGGQPMQIYYLCKKGYKVGEATAIAITRFFVQMFAWAFVGAVLMIVGFPALRYITNETMKNTLIVMGWIGFALVLSLPLFTVCFILFPKLTTKIVGFFIKLGHKMHIVKDQEATMNKAVKGVNDFEAAVKIMCQKPLNFFILIVLSLLEPLITIALPYIILLAFSGESFSFAMLFDVMTLYIYAHNSAAVIFTPGNGGAFELTLSAALSGVSANVSTWVIFVFRFLTFYSYIIIGIVLLTYELIRNIVRTQRAKYAKVLPDVPIEENITQAENIVTEQTQAPDAQTAEAMESDKTAEAQQNVPTQSAQ